MTLLLITPPGEEPVALADMKAFLKVEHDDEDALIGTLIAAARLHVEAAIRRVLVSQAWRLVLDGWPPKRTIEIPLSPVISVDTVTLTDAEGMPTILDPEAYVADVSSWPSRVLIKDAIAPGATFGGIGIDFTAGYGAASAVPASLALAIRQLAAHWYETREPVAFGAPASDVPQTFTALIVPFRAVSL